MTAQGQRRYQPVASAKGTSLLLVERGTAGFEVGKRLIAIALTTAWLIPVWSPEDGWDGC